MEINRVWAMPNKWTFQIKPIAELLKRYDVGKGWIDPFAGMYSPAEYTNDLNPNCNAVYHLEAIDFVNKFHPDEMKFDGAILDPPYSLTEVSRNYLQLGKHFYARDNPTGAFSTVKDVLKDLVKQEGYVISFGWNSVGMGKKRGFKIVEIMLVSHGGNRNDTIVTVEKRLKIRQLPFDSKLQGEKQ